jgi:hypothetical protein
VPLLEIPEIHTKYPHQNTSKIALKTSPWKEVELSGKKWKSGRPNQARLNPLSTCVPDGPSLGPLASVRDCSKKFFEIIQRNISCAVSESPQVFCKRLSPLGVSPEIDMGNLLWDG